MRSVVVYAGWQTLVERVTALADPTLTRQARRDLIQALEADYAPMVLRDLIALSAITVDLGNHDCLSALLKFWTGDPRHGNYAIEHAEHPPINGV